MPNPLKVLQSLFPAARVSVGDVSAVAGQVVTVILPGGGHLIARGAATVGQRVFIRDGVIQGDAPDLPVVEISV